MSKKIEIMGISVEKCYAENVMESINKHWHMDTLATYGVLTMNLLVAAQKDKELKEYIEALDKVVVRAPEIVRAAGIQDEDWENDIAEQVFFGSLFWLLNKYKNEVFILGESEEDTEKLYGFLEERYPNIVVMGRDSLLGGEADQVDKVINEINSLNPQAVLSCSRVYDMERFVKRNRKMMNTKVWLSLGNCTDIMGQSGSKAAWLDRFVEKVNFKKLVSKYNEDTGKM